MITSWTVLSLLIKDSEGLATNVLLVAEIRLPKLLHLFEKTDDGWMNHQGAACDNSRHSLIIQIPACRSNTGINHLYQVLE